MRAVFMAYLGLILAGIAFFSIVGIAER